MKGLESFIASRVGYRRLRILVPILIYEPRIGGITTLVLVVVWLRLVLVCGHDGSQERSGGTQHLYDTIKP
jgi:hypothetical protein